jgi:signal transduction histidine kinase
MPAPQHGRMHASLRKLLQPLNLAALCTVFAIALSLRWVPSDRAPAAWLLLSGFVLAFLARDLCSQRMPRLANALLLLQPLLALALVWLTPRIGTAQVLLVVWTAIIAMTWTPRSAFAAVAAADVGVYLILRGAGHDTPLIVTLLYAGFQAFAAVTAHYAMSAERSRDQLALVNADLLATRALLADATRDAERVRVARELHDIAGHKLTAMTLNLRALATDPAFAARDEVRIAQQLSAELLGDIRNVVQALRDTRGLDLATALRALAAPLPKPALRLRIDDDVRIDDPALAEAILRIVQEALTNAARHAGANTLAVSLACDGDGLRLVLEDDGQVRGVLRPGNGLTGMRERVEACGGTVAFAVAPRGALRIDARLPA